MFRQETQAIGDLASYVTSITAQPQFTAAVSAFKAAIPSSVLSELESAPESLLLEVATGTAAKAYFSAVPTSVRDYVVSVGEQAISILEKDTGLTEIPAGLFPTAPAVPYAYPKGGHYSSSAMYVNGRFARLVVPTGINPTGASPSGFLPEAPGWTHASGSGFAQPTQNAPTFNPTIQPFQGAAVPRKGALGVTGSIGWPHASSASPSGFVPRATGWTHVSGSGFAQPTQNAPTFNPTIQPFQGAAVPRKGALGVTGSIGWPHASSASPSGFVPRATGWTHVSGSGFAQPTQNAPTFNPTIQPFQGVAAPRKAALVVAGLLAGAVVLFVS